MPTVIDELIVTLGLDPSQFKKEAAEANRALTQEKDAALKRGKEIEASNKKQSAAFNTVKNEALGYLAVLVGAGSVTAFIGNTVKTDAAVGRLSDTLAVSTREISTWQALMRETGGSSEDAAAALQNLVDLNTRYRLGTLDPARAGLLARLGVTPEDLREPTKAALAMAAAFERLDPRVAADYARRLGFSPAYINTIKDGRKALADHIETAKALGQITEEDARKAEEFQRSIEGLKTALVSLGRDAMRPLLPLLTEYFNKVTAFVQSPSYQKFMQMAVLWVGPLAPAAMRERARAGAGLAPGQTAPTPPATALTPPVAGPTSGPANRRGSFALAVAYWKSHGYTDAQARGMAAGMKAENDTFDPGRVNPTSGAYGIGQWMGPRRADFKRVMGKDIQGSSWGEQMAFMQWELTHKEKTAGDSIRAATTEEEALRRYVGQTNANGKGGFGFMRPMEGREVAGDLRRGKAALASNPPGGSRTSNLSIGTLNVQTRATDATGLARDLPSALQRAVPQANVGMQ